MSRFEDVKEYFKPLYLFSAIASINFMSDNGKPYKCYKLLRLMSKKNDFENAVKLKELFL